MTIDPLQLPGRRTPDAARSGAALDIRVLDGQQAAPPLRRPQRRQPLVQQLPGPDDAPEAEAARARGRSSATASAPGSVRPIAGTMDLHEELERRLAEFKQTEAVVVFQSGFTANAGTVSSILTRDDVVVSDELNHASIIDGCRLSRATIKVFPHKDVGAARKILRELPAGAAEAPHHRRRLQHGRRPRAGGGAVRSGRGVGRDHDGGRRPRERRVRPERARHGRPLRRARARAHPGRARCRRRSARSAATWPAAGR